MVHPCNLRPHTGDDTARILDHAIHQLATTRNLTAHDPAGQIHLIGSLLEQGQTTLTTRIIHAIDHGHTRTEITILLGLG
jgi:UDP-N-acetylmuramyl tripeptide synthase